jgi:GST-like protein
MILFFDRSSSAKALVGITDFPHVKRALSSFMARPAVVKGLGIPQRVQ